MNRGLTRLAESLKHRMTGASPLIEELTREVCPGCRDVCCRQKHGLYQEGDLRFLNALGEDAPVRDRTRPPEGPCESMGSQGCILPRWLRPFKCTSYFCEPLLAALAVRPPKASRLLSSEMQAMADIRREMDGRAGPQ